MSGKSSSDGGPDRPRRRMALGVTTLAHVSRAIDRLAAAGIPADDVALVAEAGNVDEGSVRAVAATNGARPAVFFRSPTSGRAATQAMPPEEGKPSGEGVSLSHWLVNFEGWLTRELALDLTRQLQTGAIILAVVMGLGDIERVVSEILLRRLRQHRPAARHRLRSGPEIRA